MHNNDTPAATVPLLQVENLKVELRGASILHDINLAVLPGTIHVLMGPNGGGKTTLIRAILGGMPHEGLVRFNFRADGRIGYVPQFLDFDHSVPITVADFLTIMIEKTPAFWVSPKKRRARIEEMLAVTKTERLVDRLIGNLSGGEFRRVLLAQALIPKPELLLLDEPASNVDETGAALFEEILTDLSVKQGITIFMVAHDISMVMRVANWVTGVNRDITFEGVPQELRDPQTLGKLFGTVAFSIADRLAGCD
ncbi:MAG: metal ABC transporter ATP-binding protein [Candidatus Lernaella stagnicola]|nr:metal ABC transporter ATP-binding protein [Candidatus Lernaella stagnicola]